jgi:hypothetical protein
MLNMNYAAAFRAYCDAVRLGFGNLESASTLF